MAILGDEEYEHDERFGLELSNPNAAGPGGRAGFATIVDDDPPPPPPPPPHPTEHTLLGLITYVSAFGPGFDRIDALGPFGAPGGAEELAVLLQRADGSVVAEQWIIRKGLLDIGSVPYRFDALGACAGCTVVLRSNRGFEDQAPVSFDGGPGETEVDLEYARGARGGVVEGEIVAPAGTRPGRLRIAILDASGRVLADDARAPSCATAANYGCAGIFTELSYRLIGLPLQAQPVRVVLKQTRFDGSRAVETDAAEFELDPSGVTEAPALTAVGDPPSGTAATGRSLYGQLNFRLPFGVGDRSKDELDLPGKDREFKMELRGPGGTREESVKDFARSGTGYTGYLFSGLDPCEGCRVVLIHRGAKVAEEEVTIPARTPGVTRRDLNTRAAGEGEFLMGTVVRNAAEPRSLRIEARDAATGEVLGTTPRSTGRCVLASKCQRPIYRLGKLPPDRDIVLTLLNGSNAVDSQRITTAPEGEVTQAPVLIVPWSRTKRSLHGYVRPGGSFGPGGEPRLPRTEGFVARLLDPSQRVVGETRMSPNLETALTANLFVIDNAPPCQGCTLELLEGNVVSDRVAVDVRAGEPAVTVQDLGQAALSGGAYVQGDLVVRRPGDASGLHVQVLGADRRVLIDSAKVRDYDGAANRKAGEHLRYRLGGIARDAGTVTVAVFDGRKRLSSRNVTLAGGIADTEVPDLRVDFALKRG